MELQHSGIKINLQKLAYFSKGLLSTINEIFVMKRKVVGVAIAQFAIVYLKATRPVSGCGIDVPICKPAAVLELDGRTHGSARVPNDVQNACIRETRSYGIQFENVCGRFLSPSRFSLTTRQHLHDLIHRLGVVATIGEPAFDLWIVQ